MLLCMTNKVIEGQNNNKGFSGNRDSQQEVAMAHHNLAAQILYLHSWHPQEQPFVSNKAPQSAPCDLLIIDSPQNVAGLYIPFRTQHEQSY